MKYCILQTKIIAATETKNEILLKFKLVYKILFKFRKREI